MQYSKSISTKIPPAEKKENFSKAQLPWSGMVSIEDTALHVTDHGGAGIPVIYLNGQFATQGYWRKVITALGSGFRHITYDERARGRKSGKSVDYSFEACIRDVDTVLTSREIKKCVIVGWSYGAFLAAHWASRNPDTCMGAVLVDGAQPYDWMTKEMEKQMLKLFKRLNLLLFILRPTGLTPRLSAAQMADINIELGWLARKSELGPVMDKITVPTRYVLASGTSFGSKGDGQERIRTGVNEVIKRNPNIKISAKVSGTHDKILKKDFDAVAKAINEVCTIEPVIREEKKSVQSSPASS